MFEDSLVESNHRIKTRSRYWSLVAILINSGAAIALVIWPLLHPQALPTANDGVVAGRATASYPTPRSAPGESTSSIAITRKRDRLAEQVIS